MIRKIRDRIQRIFNIIQLNKKYHCSISTRSSISLDSTFEGRNSVHKSTVISQTSIGYASYISHSCFFSKTKIGRFCSIAPNVKVIAGNHPTRNFVSTSPVFYNNHSLSGLNYGSASTFSEYKYTDDTKRYFVEIGNDVWIGENVLILNGIKISDGAVIGAGSIVTRDVPSYSIVAGVPAKILRYRFTDLQVQELLRIQWWNKDDEWLTKKSHYFSDIERFIGSIND